MMRVAHGTVGMVIKSIFADGVSPLQAQGVKEVSDYVAQLRRVGKGLGVWEFDKIMAERATTMGQA